MPERLGSGRFEPEKSVKIILENMSFLVMVFIRG
jgi:hypothetical protein